VIADDRVLIAQLPGTDVSKLDPYLEHLFEVQRIAELEARRPSGRNNSLALSGIASAGVPAFHDGMAFFPG
jgi:hypothetical protein